jgi:hypothetical protein
VPSFGRQISSTENIMKDRPPAKRVRYLEDNMGALQVKLTEGDKKKIAERVAQFQVVGERYTPDMMALVQRA